MMRKIKPTKQFRRDYKREIKGNHRATLERDLESIITALANNIPLNPRYHDHALSNNWKDHRDCHIKPDLILIYKKPDSESLDLVRLGSHSELSL